MSTIDVSGADDAMLRCAKDLCTSGVDDRNARVMEENIKHAKIITKSESLMDVLIENNVQEMGKYGLINCPVASCPLQPRSYTNI